MYVTIILSTSSSRAILKKYAASVGPFLMTGFLPQAETITNL